MAEQLLGYEVKGHDRWERECQKCFRREKCIDSRETKTVIDDLHWTLNFSCSSAAAKMRSFRDKRPSVRAVAERCAGY